MPLTRLAATPVMRTTAELRAVARLAGAPHRVLSTMAGPWLAPPLADRLPLPAPLRTRVRALAGRLVVANPCAAARLPRAVGPLAHAVLRRALEERPAARDAAGHAGGAGILPDVRLEAERRRVDALLAHADDRAREAIVAGGARWCVVVLYEPTTLDVRLGETAGATVEPTPAPLVAAPCFRLALVLGRTDAAPPADELDELVRAAPAIDWPPGGASRPWLVTRLLLPDAIVARGMDASTLGTWGALTGRAGPAGRDTYWYVDSWDRFLEPGRFVGHVTPADVARSRRAAGCETLFEPVTSLTPSVERGVCVPPGYGLVDCVGTLEVCVLAL